jgi:small subunit ribosomal protein S1
MNEGDIVTGIVDEITSYGAFIKFDAELRGLLHITDLSWRRARHPEEIVALGETITVKILKKGISNDGLTTRYSLGLKQMTPDPWQCIQERRPVGKPVEGTITHIADYGIFVRICPTGIEGFVHRNLMSEPPELYSIDQQVTVIPVSYHIEGRRIELKLQKDNKNEQTNL